MKKNKVYIVSSIIIILLCVANIIFGNSIRDYRQIRNINYDEANEKTQGFDEYGMNISTIVTITEGESIKQNAIDQTIGIKGLNKGNLIYKVETNATTTDSETNSHSTAENAYIYWNNTYFYNYPGVKYQSPIEKDAAERNIRNLMNIISFDKEEMVDLSKEYEDEHAIFTFSVGYESVSDYVKSLLQSAANNFESVNFKPVDATAIAKVNKAEIIIERELYVEYKGENGERIVLEIYTELTSTPEIEVPNSKEYAK